MHELMDGPNRKHYTAQRHANGAITIWRKVAKIKGKANVKRAKRARRRHVV